MFCSLYERQWLDETRRVRELHGRESSDGVPPLRIGGPAMPVLPYLDTSPALGDHVYLHPSCQACVGWVEQRDTHHPL